MNTPKQLLLDWGTEQPQTLDSFVAGRNAELAHRLRQLAAGLPDAIGERFIYLWGEAGAGKTHLLTAIAAQPGLAPLARILGAETAPAGFLFDPAIRLYLLDDCDKLPPDAQVAAFALFNDCREQGATLVAAGSVPPATLDVREDLRTRFGWGLVYQVQGLSDEEKIDALERNAAARGFSVSPGVLPYLITHFHRDMRSLSAMLDALDRYSLETKRPITLPLLRELMQAKL